MKLPVRYLAMHNALTHDVVEADIRHTHRTWELDSRESACVLVDLWSTHILRSHLERYTEITNTRIAPLLPHCRQAGITVVHAPGFTIAKRFAQWEAYADDRDRESPVEEQPRRESQLPALPDWPPKQFCTREGEFERLARPFFSEEIQLVGEECYRDRMILESAAPQGDDFVVASGRQLHRLLADRRIKHLFYMGFSTDGCVQDKDYGTKAMAKLGYNIILLRDQGKRI